MPSISVWAQPGSPPPKGQITLYIFPLTRSEKQEEDGEEGKAIHKLYTNTEYSWRLTWEHKKPPYHQALFFPCHGRGEHHTERGSVAFGGGKQVWVLLRFLLFGWRLVFQCRSWEQGEGWVGLDKVHEGHNGVGGFQALFHALSGMAKIIFAIQLFCFFAFLNFFCAILLSNCTPLRIMCEQNFTLKKLNNLNLGRGKASREK